MPISSPQLPKSRANHAAAKSRRGELPAPGSYIRWSGLLSAAIITAAVVAVYWNSFSGAMLLDDHPWILENSSIKDLSSIRDILFPKDMAVLGGRPLVSLSLAVNYAIGGTNPFGYHLVNLIIHLLAALTLFGIVWRTLLLPVLSDRFGRAATPLALSVALVWAVHPLQTAAVTYIIQRTESLMGLFYLSTLYCVIRGATVELGSSRKRRLWYTGAVTACALGMLTKEVMFTAPLVIVLYDSLFLASSLRGALSERRWLYACLALTWPLGALMLWLTAFHANTTGFGVAGFTWQSYALTQPGAILHYLQSAFWPAGLCLDYGWPAVNSIWQVVIPGIIVAALLAATVFGLAKRSPLGFLGACFFLILAPTSSFIPILDPVFDHRMYLPLAALTTLIVIAVYVLWTLIDAESRKSARGSRVLRWIVPSALLVAALAGLGWATIKRNQTFESEEAIWRDVISKRPENWRAYASLALASERAGNKSKAIELYRQALERDPQQPQVHVYLGSLLDSRDAADQAIEHFRQAVKFAPRYALANERAWSRLGEEWANR